MAATESNAPDIGPLLRRLIADGRITDPASPRGRLLAAAAALFRQKGYAATTVRDIATDVGILSGSIFHHVKNKEEILFGVMLEIVVALTEMLRARLAAAGDTRAKVRALIETELIAIHGPTSNATMVLVMEWRALSAPLQQKILAGRADYDALWESTLAQARAEGLIAMEPAIMRQLIHGAISWTVYWFHADGELSLEALVARVCQLAIKP